jgi:hypothetical protein
MLRAFKLRSTHLRQGSGGQAAPEIPATRSGVRWIGEGARFAPLLPLGSSFKKRCGNFDHGIPWAKCPQHWAFSKSSVFSVFPCLQPQAGGESYLLFNHKV